MPHPSLAARRNLAWRFTLIPVIFALSACRAAAPAQPADTPAPPTETSAPLEAPTATSEIVALSFEPAIYADADAGFSFQYPASWQVDDSLNFGPRASVVQLSSWQHAPGDFENQPADGTVLSVTVQRWDPVNDLEAYISNWKIAWDASGFTIQSEERGTRASDQPVAAFRMLTAEGLESFMLLSPVGDRYLQFGGSGDIDLLAEIAATLQ